MKKLLVLLSVCLVLIAGCGKNSDITGDINVGNIDVGNINVGNINTGDVEVGNIDTGLNAENVGETETITGIVTQDSVYNGSIYSSQMELEDESRFAFSSREEINVVIGDTVTITVPVGSNYIISCEVISHDSRFDNLKVNDAELFEEHKEKYEMTTEEKTLTLVYHPNRSLAHQTKEIDSRQECTMGVVFCSGEGEDVKSEGGHALSMFEGVEVNTQVRVRVYKFFREDGSVRGTFYEEITK